MSRGRFIVLDGSEGVGKSTNLNFVSEYLESKGATVTVTREPGGTVLGERLRSILLERSDDTIHPDAELLLMFAARAQHIHQVILPALAQGNWVLSDRFTDASFAYQGGGRNIPISRIGDLEQWVQGELRPDLVLLLDAPVDIGAARTRQRAPVDRFEMEKSTFFERVRQAYLQRAATDPQRYAVIDAAQPVEAVQLELKTALNAFLAQSYGV